MFSKGHFLPRRYKAFLALIAILLTAGSLSRPLPASAQTAVSLLRFTATGRSNNILIEWETATEFNNAGFFVWASDTVDGTYNPISDFIESQGDGVTGAIYGYVDTDVEAAIPRYYKLEAIELNQNSEFFGPVSAAANLGLPTATITPTPTTSITATSTQQGGAQEITPTATLTQAIGNPTATTAPEVTSPGNESAYPGLATATLTLTPAFNFLGTPYPGAENLTPIPSPADQVVTPTPASGEIVSSEPTSATEPTQRVSPTATLPVGGTRDPQEVANLPGTDGVQLPPFTALLVVLLIWAILAGWFYISVRRLE